MRAPPAIGSGDGLELVAVRQLLRPAPLVWLALASGDRPVVAEGESVLAGALLAERVRDAVVADIPADAVAPEMGPGGWWEDDGRRHGLRRTRAGVADGELLYRVDGDWRIATGPRPEQLEAPTAGIVREVRPGSGILLEVAGAGIPGVAAIGGPARGRLDIVARADEDLRSGSLDVARSGAIVVAGSRIDAEALTKARATGVRGIVVAGVSGRDLRDIAASEARQRASLHRLPPFAILVLEGHVRAPIASPVTELLASLAGREVAIVGDPPLLLVDPPPEDLPVALPDRVRVRRGPLAGREGRWIGLAGRRRFAAGVHLEGARVDLGDDRPVAIPLADLERFG
jgi:hypothetical protein